MVLSPAINTTVQQIPIQFNGYFRPNTGIGPISAHAMELRSLFVSFVLESATMQ